MGITLTNRVRRLKRNSSYSEIARIFFSLLLKKKPVNWGNKEWLEHLFSIKERDITRYKARKQFEIPGLFLKAPNVAIQGVGYRKVRRGQEVLVRTDAQFPNIIHIEFNGGLGGKEQVFQLDETQWDRTKLLLDEWPFRSEEVRGDAS